MSAYVPSVTAERIGRALSDLAQGLSEFAEAIEAPTAKLREILRDIEEMLGAKPVPD